MNYIKRVKSTMKQGCDVELGPKTLLVGPNGSGKSTVAQSAELATRGTVSDFEGRDQVKLHTSLARLFAAGSSMEVEVTLSNDDVCSWKMEAKKRGGGFKKPKTEIGAQVRWPLQELQEILTGSENRVASWLETMVLGDLTEADLLRAMPPELRDDTKQLMKGGKPDFMELAKKAKDQARTLRANATRTEKTVESMVQGVAPPLLDEEREKLRAELEGLKPKPGEVTQEQYDLMETSIGSLVERYVEAQNELKSTPEVDPQIRLAVQKVGAARNLIQQHITTFGADQCCWVCGSTNVVPNQRSERLDRAAEALAPQIAIADNRSRLEQTLSSVEQQLRHKVAEREAVKGIAENHQAERDAILAKLAADDAARQTWRNAEAQRTQTELDRKKAARLSKISKALSKAGKELLESSKESFSQGVSVFLPGDETVDVDLAAGRVGLLRDGELHTALSGAEWTRVLVALAAYWTRDSSTPCVLAPADRAWDSDTLGEVMAALSDAPCQVIIMSTVEPAASVEGWTICPTA